jgi:biopolymer transport protein ExbB
MFMSILLQIVNSAGTVSDTVQAAAQQPAVQEYEKLQLFELAMKGGWVMIPLVVLSIVAIYIFVERFLATKKAALEDASFMSNIRNYIHEGKIDSARALCQANKTPLARMIEKGIMRIGRPLNDISAAIENVGKLEVSKLEKSVAFLSMTAGAAPMIGFMGTVSGMIKAFYNLSMAGNNLDIALLSGGIYEAMVTTLSGLIVGIIAYVCYNVIVARIEKVVFILEARATEFIDILNEPA